VIPWRGKHAPFPIRIPIRRSFTPPSGSYKEDATMLVLSRKKNESIVINDDITIVVVEIRGDKVRLGVEAPKHVPVHRREVQDAIDRQNAAAAAKAKTAPPAGSSTAPQGVAPAGVPVESGGAETQPESTAT
jgi:carbon storage regulator